MGVVTGMGRIVLDSSDVLVTHPTFILSIYLSFPPLHKRLGVLTDSTSSSALELGPYDKGTKNSLYTLI